MNTQAEIQQAFADYRAGRFLKTQSFRGVFRRNGNWKSKRRCQLSPEDCTAAPARTHYPLSAPACGAVTHARLRVTIPMRVSSETRILLSTTFTRGACRRLVDRGKRAYWPAGLVLGSPARSGAYGRVCGIRTR